MAFSSVLFGLLVVIAPAIASQPKAVHVMRRTAKRSSSSAWGHAAAQSSTQQGLPFWRALRQELEAKKKDLSSYDARESSILSAAMRRDLLWRAVREVDDKFHQRYVCEIAEGTTFASHAKFLEGQTSYRKANVESSRECALMCAADGLGERNNKDLACKSFVYNKTAEECKFFNFAQQGHHALVKDACCTSGPPCNLASMREEIQKAFEVELMRAPIANHHDTPKEHTQQLHKTQQIHSVVREAKPQKVETKVTMQTEHVAPKVEQKVVAQNKHIVAKVEQKVVAQIKHVVPKVEEKAVMQTERVAPKVEPKVVVQKRHVVVKVEQKTVAQAEHVVPKVDRKVVTQTKQVAVEQPTPVKPLDDQISSGADVANHEHARRLRQRTLGIYMVAGVMLVSTLALAWQCRSFLAAITGRKVKYATA